MKPDEMPTELAARYAQCLTCNHARVDEIREEIEAYNACERNDDFHGCHRAVAAMLDRFDVELAKDYRAWHATLASLSVEETSAWIREEKTRPADNVSARIFIAGMVHAQGKEILTFNFKELLEIVADMSDAENANTIQQIIRWYDADPANARAVIDSVLKESADG